VSSDPTCSGSVFLSVAGLHLLISFRSETTLGCKEQLTGRSSKARTPPPDERLMEMGHFAKSPRPGERAEAQYLGEMPWVSRATAMMPDHLYVARARPKVKEYGGGKAAQR
jgi:hypothetical protein